MQTHALYKLMLVAALAAAGFFPVGILAAEPPLPPGLAGPAQDEAPENTGTSSEPPLPPGLGGPAAPEAETSDAESSSGPPLPPGLSGPSEAPSSEPALPPGLAPESDVTTDVDPEDTERRSFRDAFPLPIHGFWDTRAGVRIQDDPAQPRDFVLGETRLQLQTEKAWDNVVLEYTGDFLLDGVTEEADFDLRRLRLTWSPLPSVDLRIGRQVLTWGTGDLLFINDLFPKDFQSFLSGRDEEYLKAPSDAVRVGWYNDLINVELVYTPNFDPDRYITGERISYYNPLRMGRSGRENQVRTREPNSWFTHDEWALRLYRRIASAEMAIYAYDGYWKSPAGQSLWPLPPQATFPRLRVYGASWRQPVGRGLVNVELGYYDSLKDRRGADPFTNNSELRFLIGYEREVGRNFTVGIQYYLEHMLKHRNYRENQPFFIPNRDQNRHVFTTRLTKLLMNQNLTLSLFVFYSPSDQDAYFRPMANYKITDAWMVEAGANLFVGEDNHTFFGQLEKNSSVYAAMRYSF